MGSRCPGTKGCLPEINTSCCRIHVEERPKRCSGAWRFRFITVGSTGHRGGATDGGNGSRVAAAFTLRPSKSKGGSKRSELSVAGRSGPYGPYKKKWKAGDVIISPGKKNARHHKNTLTNTNAKGKNRWEKEGRLSSGWWCWGWGGGRGSSVAGPSLY